MRKEWINYAGSTCWGEEFYTVKEVKELTEEMIRDVDLTGIGLTEDRAHVVCWYVLKSGGSLDARDALYIVSDYPAKEVALMADTGETMGVMEASESGRRYAVGYVAPGPVVTSGIVDFPAGSVHIPASLTAVTFWTGTGYVHNPDF